MRVLNNAYFAQDDPRVEAINGEPLHPTWWSRFYEYAFAMRFMDKHDVVADMGCGWMGRPLTAELARNCKEVYGIDADPRVQWLENDLPNLYYIPMDFCSDEMSYFKTSTFDKIFCISVLEDLDPKELIRALRNFKRLVKPNGKIIITMDTIWEPWRTAKPYPTVNVNTFVRTVKMANLRFFGHIETILPDNAVHQSEWNLACWHCVLER
jgi:2-polyprenyl-3-methyl-5-hydroxy-6-metoxy-1,4-benzoquinol methylase